MAIKIKNDEMNKEMQECTFSPKISTNTTIGRALQERVGDRSTRSQGKI